MKRSNGRGGAPQRGEKPRDAVLAGAFSVERDHVAYVQKGGVLHGVLIVGEQAAWHQNESKIASQKNMALSDVTLFDGLNNFVKTTNHPTSWKLVSANFAEVVFANRLPYCLTTFDFAAQRFIKTRSQGASHADCASDAMDKVALGDFHWPRRSSWAVLVIFLVKSAPV
ncbi:hypothetical protein TYRP_017631 [Tyrophagus putrescentiae]|nr:hypothetical protein TYRP_017631 [Tyrophagus putrescentiae]